jgi:hypothetical protein
MKTSISVIILTIAFLSAGAFAQNETATPFRNDNVTVVFKNQSWPVKGQIAIDTCSINRCTDI